MLPPPPSQPSLPPSPLPSPIPPSTSRESGPAPPAQDTMDQPSPFGPEFPGPVVKERETDSKPRISATLTKTIPGLKLVSNYESAITIRDPFKKAWGHSNKSFFKYTYQDQRKVLQEAIQARDYQLRELEELHSTELKVYSLEEQNTSKAYIKLQKSQWAGLVGLLSHYRGLPDKTKALHRKQWRADNIDLWKEYRGPRQWLSSEWYSGLPRDTASVISRLLELDDHFFGQTRFIATTLDIDGLSPTELGEMFDSITPYTEEFFRWLKYVFGGRIRLAYRAFYQFVEAKDFDNAAKIIQQQAPTAEQLREYLEHSEAKK
ncbi:hypothetical protein K491DRAFT_683131 [Lophiostoma macrostomum CBS 122681]|uniref:Uncharacterized protein n=1 Tax=Lophiostoma macrostomum CBS 122681 TaxID=1314788 RepID=A0A6A6SRX1_9PLEO|nr:hypothetical protein K491DRAFT_683131 [Lophiostoma macrostomum CBS 122681]